MHAIRVSLRIPLSLITLGFTVLCTRPAAAQVRDTAGVHPDSARGKPDLGPMRNIEFDVDEGTWMSLDVSPDGRTLLFDLLGDIYTLPIEGGQATRILGGRDWDHMPRFSPDGRRIAFVSDRDGDMNIWLANADGSQPKALTHERVNSMKSPAWTPDGLYVIAHKSASGPGAAGLFLYHRDGGSGFKVDSASGMGPAFSPDGRFLYFASNGVYRLDRNTGRSVRLTESNGGGMRPVPSPDGRWLAYGRLHDAETTLHLRDLRTGEDRVLLHPITPHSSGNQDELPGYAFTPDSRSVIIAAGGHIHRVNVADGSDHLIPFHAHVSQQLAQVLHLEKRLDDGPLAARIMRWPSLSPDGRRLVFSAIGRLYIADVPGTIPPAPASKNGASGHGPSAGVVAHAASPVTGARRLTNSSEREYTPVFSPDGKWIAYTTWSDSAFGQLRLISPDGKQRRTVSTIPGRYVNPVWSPDGTKLAFVRGSGTELRGGLSDDEPYVEIEWLPVEGGESHFVTAAPYNSGFALRYYPVISFSADGTRLFYTERSNAAPGAGQRTTLASIRLDGTDKKSHFRFVPVDEVIPSPDGRHVAFGRRETVVVVDMPEFSTTPIDLNFEGGALPVKKLALEGGVFVHWLDSATLGWSFIDTYYRQKLDANAPDTVAKVEISVPRAAPGGRVAFTNARIVTMKGNEVIERGTLLVERNRITGVGAAPSVQIPSGTTVVDAGGKTIMPGLIDVHSHMHYASMEFHPQQKWEYVAQLAYGVTTTFDPSAHNLDVFPQSEMVESGEMLGPRILSTGDVIYGSESVFPVVYEPINGIEDARRIVRRYKGYDPIMLKEYMQPRRDQRQWLAQAAREHDVEITAEGGADWVMDMTMVLDGYSAVEHALPIEIHDDVVQLYARSATHYTPTLIVGYGGPTLEQYFHNKGDYHDNAKLRRYVPESGLDAWRHYQHIPDDEWHFLDVSKGAANVTHAGGLETLGAHGQLQGLGALWELWGLSMGGLSPLETIRAGTFNGALKLGLDRDLGSLESGKLADFIVLDDNPLTDIHNMEKQHWIVKNGFVYDAESMAEVWPELKPLPKFFWMPAADAARFRAPPARPLGR